MQCYTELTPPTAVTHSLCFPFLSASANNLIVAKTSLLQIFSLKTVLSDAADPTNIADQSRRVSINAPTSSVPVTGTLQRGDKVQTTKLVLLAQYKLSGIVTSLARIKISNTKSGGQALLVSLRTAKVSLIEWDPESYSISTISIHLYERENTGGNPWDPDIDDQVNYLSVDPRGRCAALKFGSRHLAILPFHQQSDDLAMDGYDPDIDGEKEQDQASDQMDGGNEIVVNQTPYSASFVLSMLALDPSLLHPVHLAFLYEYREPTFGILSSQNAAAISLLHDRRDSLSYTVITLDLEQRASTALLSVNNLPYDIFKVIPLRLPIGGALLIGGNEIIHVDQAGKANGVAVNDIAKTSTAFPLADQANLAFRLEGSVVEQLGYESSELLLMMNTGELGIIGFKIDGRSVSGLSIRQVSEQMGGSLLLAGPSCASLLGRGRMFVGNEDADSVVLGWSRKLDKIKRQRSAIQLDADEEINLSDLEDDIDDDDDLYAAAPTEEKKEGVATPVSLDEGDDYRFRLHDSLENFGPMRNIAFGKPRRHSETQIDSITGQELIATAGRGRAGGLTMFCQSIDPTILERHLAPNVDSFWTVSVTKSAAGTDKDTEMEYIFTTSGTNEGEARSAVYSLKPSGMEEITNTDFEPEAGATVEIGTLNSSSRIVQVLPGELKTFNAGTSITFIASPSAQNSFYYPLAGTARRYSPTSLKTNVGHLSIYAFPVLLDTSIWRDCRAWAHQPMDVFHITPLIHSLNENMSLRICSLCFQLHCAPNPVTQAISPLIRSQTLVLSSCIHYQTNQQRMVLRSSVQFLQSLLSCLSETTA